MISMVWTVLRISWSFDPLFSMMWAVLRISWSFDHFGSMVWAILRTSWDLSSSISMVWAVLRISWSFDHFGSMVWAVLRISWGLSSSISMVWAVLRTSWKPTDDTQDWCETWRRRAVSSILRVLPAAFPRSTVIFFRNFSRTFSWDRHSKLTDFLSSRPVCLFWLCYNRVKSNARRSQL